MGAGFFSYIERLELMGFFSAYPLVYALVSVIATSFKAPVKKIFSLLPYTYALVGLLYLGLQLKNLYPDYSFENIRLSVQQPFLKIWALLTLLFWIPFFAKKPVLSLLHSLVFFFFLLRDLYLQTSLHNADKTIVRNEMKLYTDSFLLFLSGFTAILLLSFLISWYKRSARV